MSRKKGNSSNMNDFSFKNLNANLLAAINQGIKEKIEDPNIRFKIETNMSDSLVNLYIIKEENIIRSYQFLGDEKVTLEEC